MICISEKKKQSIVLLVFFLQEHGIDANQLAQMVEEDLENLGIPKVCNLDLVC